MADSPNMTYQTGMIVYLIVGRSTSFLVLPRLPHRPSEFASHSRLNYSQAKPKTPRISTRCRFALSFFVICSPIQRRCHLRDGLCHCCSAEINFDRARARSPKVHERFLADEFVPRSQCNFALFNILFIIGNQLGGLFTLVLFS